MLELNSQYKYLVRIDGVSGDATDDDIRALVRERFSAAGAVHLLYQPAGEDRIGFAHVGFVSGSEAEGCVRALEGALLKGTAVRVTTEVPPPGGAGRAGGQIAEGRRAGGGGSTRADVADSERSAGSAPTAGAEESEARAAAAGGAGWGTTYDRPSAAVCASGTVAGGGETGYTTVMVWSLGDWLTEKLLLEHMSRYGAVSGVRVSHDSLNSVGKVRFRDATAAAAAVAGANGEVDDELSNGAAPLVVRPYMSSRGGGGAGGVAAGAAGARAAAGAAGAGGRAVATDGPVGGAASADPAAAARWGDAAAAVPVRVGPPGVSPARTIGTVRAAGATLAAGVDGTAPLAAETTIFVKMLALDVTEAILHSHFVQYGAISNVMIRKLVKYGLGWVTYTNPQAAAAAIESANMMTIDGVSHPTRRLHVQLHVPTTGAVVGDWGGPSTGPPSRGSATARSGGWQHGAAAPHASPLRSATVDVRGFLRSLREEQVRTWMSTIGPVVSCTVVSGDPGGGTRALVEFESESSAYKACKRWHGVSGEMSQMSCTLVATRT